MATNSQKRKSELYIKEREEGFNLRFGCSFSNQPYNALRDAHMKHFFGSEQRIQHLQKQGQIDQFGRVIDMDTHRLVVVENEIKRAEAHSRSLMKRRPQMPDVSFEENVSARKTK